MDSIKWYLNSSEIYRLVPGLQEDRVLTFPPADRFVSLPQSGLLKPGLHRLVVENISSSGVGRYTCQVTENRPPFRTEQATGSLAVFIKPVEGPRIDGLLPYYTSGDRLNVSCEAGPSLPAPSLAWRLNGKTVAATSSIKAESSSSTSTPTLLSSSSILTLHLSSSRLGPRLSLRCTAHIGQVMMVMMMVMTTLHLPGVLCLNNC